MTKFTAEEKIAAVQSYLEGVAGYDAISASIGASVSTIRTWVIQYKHNGVEACRIL
ncbi:transposase [Bacillus cereus group sp. N6]|nr:transposase [Bacillus cereus group sp. N6]